MTPEEIQRTIEQMLAVQRELQDSQLRQREELDRMLGLVDQLIACSSANDLENLTLEERLNALEHQVGRVRGR